MKIEQIDINSLIPYARNAKLHSVSQINAVASSIKEFGFNNPVLIDDNNNIIAGHCRVLASERLNLSNIPCIRLNHLDKNAKKAYLIADNRLAETGDGWDLEMLQLELESIEFNEFKNFNLDNFEFDVKITNQENHNSLKEELLEDKYEETEKFQEKWQVELGQLWRLGKHLLLCGNSSEKNNIEKILEQKADICLTDPPYSINMSQGFSENLNKSSSIKPKQYKDAWDKERPLKEHFNLILNSAKLSLIFGGNYFADILPQSKHWIVWDKNNALPTASKCELIWTNHISRTNIEKYTYTQSGYAQKCKEERFHPTQKPKELLKEILLDYSKKENIIFDPFAGSGSTLLACEDVDMIFRGIELEPKYIGVTLERYYDLTEIKPELIK